MACQSQVDRFIVNGHIADADGKVLYLDRVDVDRIVPVDSVTLKGSGEFSFSEPAGECFDFYRLRIENQSAVIVIDSTETVTFSATLPTMSTSYTVYGSEDCSLLRDLVMLQIEFQREVNGLLRYDGLETGVMQQRLNETVDLFKSQIKNEFILSHPDKPCAYYALFISVKGNMLFKPQTDRQDAKCFAAVATSMSFRYPDAMRSQHLKNVALKGMRATAPVVPASQGGSDEFLSKVSEAGIIDITLPDADGKYHKLSDLKGKVVLLDFTAYKTDYSAKYILFLRDLYNKYSSEGFTIYQVSLDKDAHFWMTSSDRLPWITVRDEECERSMFALSYNVKSLPSAFLINRENEIVERLERVDGLEDKIVTLLSE